MTPGGFQSFVAWRYLMARPRRVSRIALWMSIIGIVGGLGCLGAALYVVHRPDPHAFLPDANQGTYYGLLIAGAVSLLLGLICAVFGVIRYYFTFFTTVPIGGVWIGTMALVIVLSVMSGFENDLQGKILGSNAHIQVTKTEPEDRQGEPFTEWKDIEKKIDAVPGVVASMPFVTSEAVIAANNNYATVIIKGIDPDQVGKVTKLVQDVEDHDAAMKRLRPIVVDDLSLPDVAPPGQGSGGGTDPAPVDMPGGADPVDFSGGGEGVSDQAPDDFVAPAGGKDPQDFSEPAKTQPETGTGTGTGTGKPDTHVVEIPMSHGPDLGAPQIVIDEEGPRESKRTQSLPGILVGRELVKTIHMYTGEEVNVISPLSDASNPDTTGNPIPLHRDFRVAGVFYTGMYEYDLKFVYVPLDALQDFLDLGDAVDGIEVRITDPDATDDVGAAIERALGPGYQVRDWKDLNRNLFSALKLEKIAMFLVLAITILVASFSIVGNLIMVVVEKAKEIALLKTLGASDHGVMFLFVTQGFFIGIIGTALGVVWGLGLCWAAATWGLPLNPDVYYIDRLPIHVDSGSVLAIAAAGILISVGATIYPAWVAARLQPATGLRHD
jgi:lipoprotein-releasing system permease protein